ncbi:AraC family transcriptional regulator [Musicola paradisiaca]|uniref:Transcriptional regulator, AraC family n=1 Tax=Musicola paradisiaca (strain Ech703) TaxID=579405 RepID=C6C5P6_MUSP7|nr:AraC family transcriptional regulator [Musicola paradisiaca]ACS83859.1 transcriptional regulator, AraC family [Musicola paradisiaca Ech703]
MKARSVRLLACRQPGIEAVEADTDFSFGRHTHDQFGIGLMVRGAQKSLSGRGRVESVAGDIITVNPGEIHDGMPIDGARAWRMLYIQPEVVERCFAEISDGRSRSGEFSHPVFTDRRLAVCFRRLYLSATQQETQDGALAVQERLLMLASALAAIPRRQQVFPHRGILLARDMIDDDPSSPKTLAELAGEAGLNQFQFLRGFSRLTGLTPHAYRVQRRVLMARALIGRGTPLAEAALCSGFADQSHMTRLFVRSFGYTPGQLALASSH